MRRFSRHSTSLWLPWVPGSRRFLLGVGAATFRGAAGGAGAEGGITQDSRVQYPSSDGTTNPHNWTHAFTAASFALVKLDGEGTNLPTGVTIDGNAMTRHTASAIANGSRWVEAWYLAGSWSGSLTIEVTLAGNETCGAESVGLIGVDTSSPIADSATGTASTNTTVTLSSALSPDGTGWVEVAACSGADGLSGAWSSPITTSMDADSIEHQSIHGFLADRTTDITPSCSSVSTTNWAALGLMLRAA